MTTSDWITLGAAILVGGGTLFLGIMALRTICQTRSIQKAEKRERLLNEIIEWAIDLMKATHGQDISVVSMKEQELMSALYYSIFQVTSRRWYINRIAKIFGEKLSNVVSETINILESFTKIYVDWLKSSGEDKESKMKEVVSSMVDITTKARAVIEEATKIKTENIEKKEGNK